MKRYGLSTALIFAVTFFLGSLFSRLYEAKIYDQKVLLSAPVAPADVVLAKIDQGSIDFYSREFNLSWPWPRSLYARAIDYLAAAGARAVAVDLVLSEPGLYDGEDERLASSIKNSGHVFLPLVFRKGVGDSGGAERFALPSAPQLKRLPVRQGPVQLPLPSLRSAARGGGNAQADPDRDHVYRRILHFVGHGGRVYPSLALAMALYAEPRLDLDDIPFAADGGLNLRFYRKDSFRAYAISELIQSQVRREAGEEPVVPLSLIHISEPTRPY